MFLKKKPALVPWAVSAISHPVPRKSTACVIIIVLYIQHSLEARRSSSTSVPAQVPTVTWTTCIFSPTASLFELLSVNLGSPPPPLCRLSPYCQLNLSDCLSKSYYLRIWADGLLTLLLQPVERILHYQRQSSSATMASPFLHRNPIPLHIGVFRHPREKAYRGRLKRSMTSC